MEDRENVLLHRMADTLLESATSNTVVEKGLISQAETLITVHQLYVQLLYVGVIIDQITQLPSYLEALDSIVEDIDLEDLAEASPRVKLGAISALNQSIKTKVELVNSMMASKDAVGILISQMKENFGYGEEAEEESGDAQVMSKIKDMSSEGRQKVLGGVIQLLQKTMKGDDNE